jgi:hypothetical protein
LVAVTQQTASTNADVKFHTITETVDIDMGDKDIESIAALSGGRIVKYTPEGDTTITLEMYPLGAGSGDISAATTATGVFDLLHAEDTTQPLKISSTTGRTKYRLCILWTEDTSVTSATAAITGANKALRFTAADGFFTAVKPSFTDGVLKFTVTFKVPPRDAVNNSNIYIESTDGTASLTALQSYTTTIKL